LRIIHIILIAVFYTGFFQETLAQPIKRFNVFSYNVNEGLLQSNVVDLAIDKNNFCWISYANGIQRFDGKYFVPVPIQPGLPDDKWVGFFRTAAGELLVSHSQGISKYDVSSNRFTLIYKSKTYIKRPLPFVGEDGNSIYFFTETRSIAALDSKNFFLIRETPTTLPQDSFNFIKISDNIVNHRVAILVNSIIYLWDLQEQKIITRSTQLRDIFYYFLYLKDDHTVLYYDYKNGIAVKYFDFSINTTSQLTIEMPHEPRAFRSVIHKWQDKQLISLNNKLFETDTSFSKLVVEMVNYQNKPMADNAVIAKVREDNFGNLYLVTINEGFRKIIRNNFPIKYYGTENKVENYAIGMLADKKNNRILAGTYAKGLLVFDTLQHLIKQISTVPGTNRSFSSNMIIKTNSNDYLIFGFPGKIGWHLNKDLKQLLPLQITAPESWTGFGYFGNFLYQDDKVAYFQTESWLYKVNLTDNSIVATKVTNFSTMGSLLVGKTLLVHGNDELIYLNVETNTEIKRVPLKNTGVVRCFLENADHTIYVGSNKGIFQLDSTGKLLMHVGKEDGLPDECIYSMLLDEAGYLWCSSNRGIFRINRDRSIIHLTKDDGLQENEFNTNVAMKTADGEMFFGGVNGLTSFFPSAINNLKEKVEIIFTGIKVNNENIFTDTAVWQIRELDLKHDQNSLSFDFIAMANNNPGQYIYQYKMQGVEEEWIRNNDLQTVRYFLPPGDYVFKIYASRFFDKNAKPMKEIQIHIHPPFWKTWWFRFTLGLLLISAMAYLINQYNRRKYQKKLVQYESEQKIRMERERISRDLHDSIGAYANAILYNTELLEKEKEDTLRDELMKDLKFASKDIIASLRETIWALKKDNYTAGDCVLRIRNFIQPFTRYYQHIKFDIQGEVPEGRTLHYTKALNLVRIVQEAVTNAIKHSAPSNIIIMSNNKEGKWELIVTDDGKGFDYESIQQGMQGNGLHNMKQRAIDAGFEFSIRSWPNAGTSVITRV